MKTVARQLKRFWNDEQGLETVEYAIITGLVVAAGNRGSGDASAEEALIAVQSAGSTPGEKRDYRNGVTPGGAFCLRWLLGRL